MLRELLPDRPDLWQGELRCLRYQPERRYVAELRAADGARAVLKSYTRKAFTRGKRNATAFESRGPLRVARLLGCSEGHRLLAFEWLPGRTLLDCFAAPEVERAAAVSTAAAALAELHAQPPDGLVCWTPEDEVLYVSSLAAEIAFICPWLARRAEQLGRRLGAEMAVTPAMHLSVHGDFSGSQVLVDQREAAIIDLDSAYCGDPAYDLGKFVAQAEDCALLGDLSPSQVELLRDALLQGYGRARGRAVLERIRWYTAAALIRRARFPFRAREPDWPQRTESLLDRAEAVATRCRRESG